MKRIRIVNKEKHREYAKKYRTSHKEEIKAKRKRYKHETTSERKKKLMLKVLERDGAKCKHCGSLERLTLQHKVPQCIGGKNTLSNLEILCLKCNISDYHSLVKKALKFYFENHKE